jgi:hypothetical protein
VAGTLVILEIWRSFSYIFPAFGMPSPNQHPEAVTNERSSIGGHMRPKSATTAQELSQSPTYHGREVSWRILSAFSQIIFDG